jgi:hypothetical protein
MLKGLPVTEKSLGSEMYTPVPAQSFEVGKKN